MKFTGKKIKLEDFLGIENINKIEKVFQENLKVSFQELLENTEVFEMDFNTKMECLFIGCVGCHFNQEVWLSNPNDLNTVVHEFVHVAQDLRKGILSRIKKVLTKIANNNLHKFNLFYRLDFYEREAREIASLVD